MIRYIIAILISVAFYFLAFFTAIALNTEIKKKTHILLCIVSVVILIIMTMIPIENAFVSFSSPKDSVEYVNDSYSNIDVSKIIYGHQSCMLLSEITDAPQFSKKSDENWKIAQVKFSRYDNLLKNCYVSVYKVKGTNDYYIGISVYYSASPMVSDSKETQFIRFENEEQSRYFGYLNEFDKNYTININGTKIDLGELYFK